MNRKLLATLAVAALCGVGTFGAKAETAQAAPPHHYLAHQCGGAATSVNVLLNHWGQWGILDDQARAYHLRSVDSSVQTHVRQTFTVFTLARTETIHDNGCNPGVVVPVGPKTLKAGTQVFGDHTRLNAKYGVGGWSPKYRRGWRRTMVVVASRAMTTCTNPISGSVHVWIWLPPVQHVVKPKPRHKPKPKVVYVYAWKWAYKDGGWKNGLHFGLYAWKHRYGHHWTMTSGKWTRLTFKQGHVPKYLCEIIKYPWQAKGPKGAACQKPHPYKGRLVVIYTNYYSPKTKPVPKPTPPTPPPPTIVITQVCSNGQIVVVVGNGNNINQNGNSNGGNCNGNTTPPPSAPCTPPTVMGPNGRCIKPETPEGTQQNGSPADQPVQSNPGQNTGPTPGAPPAPTDPQPTSPTTSTTTTGTNSGVDGTSNTPTGTSSGTGGTQSSPPPPPTPPDDGGGQGDSGSTGSGTNTTDPGPPTP